MTPMMAFTKSPGPVGILAVLALCVMGATTAQVAPPPFEPLQLGIPNISEQFQDISIEQHLNAQVPLELTFIDEQGEPITLAEAIDGKPAIITLVYYECPMLCNIVLNGVEAVVDAMKFEIGDDYEVITVSIDPGETPELAAAKKANHLDRLHRKGAEKGWHFLTGDEVGIERLADAVGYRYAYDPKTDQYAHAAGIMVITGKGRIARYYYGAEYIARDVEFGLQEASRGRIGNVVDQLILLCFHYDPVTGKYGFWIVGAMRIGAALMLIGFATMYAVFFFRWRRAKRLRDNESAGPDDPGTMPSVDKKEAPTA